jgi:hypothetical protein
VSMACSLLPGGAERPFLGASGPYEVEQHLA